MTTTTKAAAAKRRPAAKAQPGAEPPAPARFTEIRCESGDCDGTYRSESAGSYHEAWLEAYAAGFRKDVGGVRRCARCVSQGKPVPTLYMQPLTLAAFLDLEARHYDGFLESPPPPGSPAPDPYGHLYRPEAASGPFLPSVMPGGEGAAAAHLARNMPDALPPAAEMWAGNMPPAFTPDRDAPWGGRAGGEVTEGGTVVIPATSAETELLDLDEDGGPMPS